MRIRYVISNKMFIITRFVCESQAVPTGSPKVTTTFSSLSSGKKLIISQKEYALQVRTVFLAYVNGYGYLYNDKVC